MPMQNSDSGISIPEDKFGARGRSATMALSKKKTLIEEDEEEFDFFGEATAPIIKTGSLATTNMPIPEEKEESVIEQKSESVDLLSEKSDMALDVVEGEVQVELLSPRDGLFNLA